MRVLAAFALLALACSNAPPAPPSESKAVTRAACVVCPGTVTALRESAVDPRSRVITPALDAADLARRLGRPELEGAIEEKIATAQARVQSALTDDQARVIVEALLADLDRLAAR